MLTNKKYFLLLILLFTSVVMSKAQLRFGLSAGINAPKLRFIENNYQIKPTTQYGFQAGIVSELNISDMFFVQSGLHFQQRGGSFIISQPTDDNTQIQTKTNYLHLPIEAGIRYYWKENTSILGSLGIFGEYGVSAKEKSGKNKQLLFFGNEDYHLNPYTVGVKTSVGIEFQNTIQVKAQYYYGFTRVYNLPNTISNQKCLSLTLAYMFGN